MKLINWTKKKIASVRKKQSKKNKFHSHGVHITQKGIRLESQFQKQNDFVDYLELFCQLTKQTHHY